MSLFELLYIGPSARNNRRGLRLPLLLGRLHLGLIFSGPSSSTSGRKSSFEISCLRSFLFIATVLTTKCGSAIPYPHWPDKIDNNVNVNTALSTTILSTTLSSPLSSSTALSSEYPQESMSATNSVFLSSYLKHLHRERDQDHQEYPMQHIMAIQAKEKGRHLASGEYIGGDDKDNQGENVKTLGYVLKGMILPMLIALTLSFGFIIYKNRVKRARLQAIQNSVESARLNPNQLIHHHPPILGGGIGQGFVSNALLSVMEARGEWSLISGGNGGATVDSALVREGDDYLGEGGETARFKPFLLDKPPDYASVFDPPTYEQAIASPPNSNRGANTPGIRNEIPEPSIFIADSSHSVGNTDDGDENEQLLPSMFYRVFSLPWESDIEDELENWDESESEEGKYLVQVTATAADTTG